jgi:hypothetical protein
MWMIRQNEPNNALQILEKLGRPRSFIFRYDEDPEKLSYIKGFPSTSTYVFDFNQDPNNLPRGFYRNGEVRK